MMPNTHANVSKNERDATESKRNRKTGEQRGHGRGKHQEGYPLHG